MSSRHNARKAAVQALYQWDITQQADNEIEANFAQIHDMQNVDRAFLRQVMREVPALKEQLETAITTHIDRPFMQLDPVERAILRLGAFELMQRRDVPTKVILNESIELAKIFGADHSYKFINGVMDKLASAVRSQ